MVIYIWQQLLLSHETGTHWITIHMTVQASTNGCESSIKQLHIAALRDPLGRPLGRNPLGRPLGRDPLGRPLGRDSLGDLWVESL